mmetsp:Transcript_27749/g.75815  ORF Transcript_27749/g.75815 Transcript_27749/m.75815 type:complete len:165 (+) Transcript_27749:198-692(+)
MRGCEQLADSLEWRKGRASPLPRSPFAFIIALATRITLTPTAITFLPSLVARPSPPRPMPLPPPSTLSASPSPPSSHRLSASQDPSRLVTSWPPTSPPSAVAASPTTWEPIAPASPVRPPLSLPPPVPHPPSPRPRSARASSPRRVVLSTLHLPAKESVLGPAT